MPITTTRPVPVERDETVYRETIFLRLLLNHPVFTSFSSFDSGALGEEEEQFLMAQGVVFRGSVGRPGTTTPVLRKRTAIGFH